MLVGFRIGCCAFLVYLRLLFSFFFLSFFYFFLKMEGWKECKVI